MRSSPALRPVPWVGGLRKGEGSAGRWEIRGPDSTKGRPPGLRVSPPFRCRDLFEETGEELECWCEG